MAWTWAHNKMTYNVTLRTLAGETAYQADIKNGKTIPLELVSAIKEWRYWRLIKNDYPGAIAFKQHDMLIIKRAGISERFDLNADEKAEFDQILKEHVYSNYHFWYENVPARRTAPHIYHVHLVKYYDKREDMRL